MLFNIHKFSVDTLLKSSCYKKYNDIYIYIYIYIIYDAYPNSHIGYMVRLVSIHDQNSSSNATQLIIFI